MELGRTYKDEYVAEVDGSVTREDLLRAWISKEASIGHWGVQENFRVVLGGFDSWGSIGFSQVQQRFKYGNPAGSARAASLLSNLYHPADAVKAFAIYSNNKDLGEGFYRVFVTTANANPDPFPEGAYPRLGDEYTDSAADKLSKGLFGYKEGAFFTQLREHSWPELLRKYPTIQGRRGTYAQTVRGIRYALTVKRNAGISLDNRKWTWTDKFEDVEFNVTYSEGDWYKNKSYDDVRSTYIVP